MLPHLVGLEAPFNAEIPRAYDHVELVRYALTLSDYWADLALAWLEEGVPIAGLERDLEVLESQRQRSQRLRHRARRLRKAG